MRLFWLTLLWVGVAHAEVVEGTLVNGTKPGPGQADSVQLILLQDTMNIIGTVTDVKGSFRFESAEPLDGKRLLLQASKDGVLYSLPLTWPSSTKVEITVYDTAEQATLETTISSVAVYAYGTTLDLAFFYNINNVSSPAVTLHRAAGNFSFDLVHGFSDLEASTRSGTMPLRQQLQVEGDRATLGYPLKPGMTQLMVRTRHPYNAAGENTIKLSLPEGQRQMKLIGIPAELKIVAEGLEFMARDDKENMGLFEFAPKAGQRVLELHISGKPLDKPLEEQTGTGGGGGSSEQQAHGAEGGGPKIENRPHFLQAYRWAIIGAMAAIFTVFAAIGWRR